jgi:hypothetical protein
MLESLVVRWWTTAFEVVAIIETCTVLDLELMKLITNNKLKTSVFMSVAMLLMMNDDVTNTQNCIRREFSLMILLASKTTSSSKTT